MNGIDVGSPVITKRNSRDVAAADHGITRCSGSERPDLGCRLMALNRLCMRCNWYGRDHGLWNQSVRSGERLFLKNVRSNVYVKRSRNLTGALHGS